MTPSADTITTPNDDDTRTATFAATLNVLHRLACPACGTRAAWPDLKCACGWQGTIDSDGRLHLHRADDTWAACLAQIAAVNKANAWAEEQKASAVPLPAGMQAQAVPTPRSVHINNAMLDLLGVKVGSVAGKTFLELGASTCWAVAWWLRQGAACGVALDINEHLLPPVCAGTVPVVGDGYHVPFLPATFDFVFDCSSLHHFTNLDAIVAELARVLKPGGWYGSQGNPPCPDSDVDGAASREKWYMDKFGLIEHMPTDGDYRAAFQKYFQNVQRLPVDDNTVWLMHKAS